MAKIFKLAVAETFYNCSFSFLLLTAVAEAFGLPIWICVSLCIVQSRIEIFTPPATTQLPETETFLFTFLYQDDIFSLHKKCRLTRKFHVKTDS